MQNQRRRCTSSGRVLQLTCRVISRDDATRGGPRLFRPRSIRPICSWPSIAAIHRWRSIHSTVGVARLVCNGEAPAAIDSGIIDGLKSRENEQGYIQLERRPQFAAGDKVRVREGVFCDCLGLFESLGDRERVAILLELLGRKVRVVLDEVFVVAA